MHFLANCLQPHAVLMLFVALICLAGYGYPAYTSTSAPRGALWVLWLILGILALVSWVLLVLS